VHRGKAYSILGVLPDEDSGIEHLTLMVSEGVRLYEQENPQDELPTDVEAEGGYLLLE
jgi:hypothetical protein